MRSGYESFLRRQLLKPRATPPRWSDTQHAATALARPEPAAPAPASASSSSAAALRQARQEHANEETMPAILWRDSVTEQEAPAGPVTKAPPLALVPPSLPAPSPTPHALPEVNPAPQPTPEPTAAAADGPPKRPAPTLAQLDSLIDQALANAKQRSGLGALLRLSVARLDEIGDAWGERAVGHVLRALHQRLARLLGQVAPQAQVLPLGDTLWVVLPRLERTSVAEALVRQLLEALTRPLTLEDNALALHGSAGLAVFPHDGTEAASVRRAAEVAGRQARLRGRGAYQFYAREIEARAKRRLALEARLRHAITHDELTLAYQPRAEVRSGALCGAELLPAWAPADQAAWQGPALLMLAEESGLAEALTHWCLRAACRQLSAWLADGLAVPQLSLPVLPSPFKRASFVATLIEQVRLQGLDPARLTLLLSPVAPLASGTQAPFNGFDLAQGAPRLMQCRDAGFRLAIDGAATSACSLATLRRLPLSELRLDSQLLDAPDATDPRQDNFAAAIVSLGHHLGLRVVASGVTQDAQLDQLLALGCDDFQGPLLSEPLDSATWAEVMAGARGAA
jgi:predicted signal transduction protein with EAL and GGDEF domain